MQQRGGSRLEVVDSFVREGAVGEEPERDVVVGLEGLRFIKVRDGVLEPVEIDQDLRVKERNRTADKIIYHHTSGSLY